MDGNTSHFSHLTVFDYLYISQTVPFHNILPIRKYTLKLNPNSARIKKYLVKKCLLIYFLIFVTKIVVDEAAVKIGRTKST